MKKINLNKIRNIKNKRFGKLKVLRFSNKVTKCGGSIWTCKCNCGKIIERTANSLQDSARENRPISCGCNRIHSQGVASFNKLLRRYTISANKKGLAFNLTKKKFKELTKENCHYCGIEPYAKCTKAISTGFYIYNGIDRKNSKLGYSEKNCVPCCRICNQAKMATPYKEFIKYLNRVVEFRK